MEWRSGGKLLGAAPTFGDGHRFWPFILTIFFGIVFAGVVDFSWLTAGASSGPWFTSSISAQVYATTLTAATIATLILASLAASKLAVLETRARAPADRETAKSAPTATIDVEGPQTVVAAPSEPMGSEGLDQILSELHRFVEGTSSRVEERTFRKEDRLARMARQGGLTVHDRAMPPAARDAVRRSRRLVWQTVTGPLVLLLAFISISGAMLPGSGAFAQAHFQLNTGLILFLSYGWPFLVAWAIASIALLYTLAPPRSSDGLGLAARFRLERIH